MQFRRPSPQDCDALVALATRGLRPNLYPLTLSHAKMRATAEFFARDTAGFSLLAFDGDTLVAYLLIARQEMPWFERHEALVVGFFSAAPGAGFHMLRQAIRWFRADPMLRRLTWALEFDVEPRILRIAEREGFNLSNVNLHMLKV